MTSIPSRLFLAVAGLTGIGLGSMILLAPVAFYAGYGLDLAGQVTLLNELRSHGLSLLAAGLFIGTGAFMARLATPAMLVAAVVYLGYGLSRLVALVLDGQPADGLLLAMAVELAAGTLATILYLRRRVRPAPLTA
jgi:hypothetical protein